MIKLTLQLRLIEPISAINRIVLLRFRSIAIYRRFFWKSPKSSRFSRHGRVVWFKRREIIYRFRLYLLISCDEGIPRSGRLLLLSCVNRKSSNNSQTWWFLSTIYLTWKFFDIWRMFLTIWKQSVFLTRNCCEFGSIATTICESSCLGWENGLHLYFAAFSVSILIDIHR